MKSLTEAQKEQILKRSPKCFVCERRLRADDDIEFDHIRSKARGGDPNDLLNYAGAHKECNRGKGTRDLEEYKEELRLQDIFNKYPSFAALAGNVKQPSIRINYNANEIYIGDEKANLHQCPNTKIWYFYHRIPTKYIESDVEVQPRPLEPRRLYNLAKHLRINFQLSPSVCRLISSQGKILLFDGQHKAAAQLLGNLNERLDCKVFIDPPLEMVHYVVNEGHFKLRQQSFKISDMAKKYRAMFRREIELWENAHPGMAPSEKNVLIDQKGYTLAQAKEFISKELSINVFEDERCLLSSYVSKAREKGKPLTYRMYHRDLIYPLVRLTPTDAAIESDEDYRKEEQDNVITILNLIVQYALKDKWSPENPSSVPHQTAINMFRESPFRYWTSLLARAIMFIRYRTSEEGVCYGGALTKEQLTKLEIACKKLFEHPIWRDPSYQAVFKSKLIDDVKRAFDKYPLNAEYLIKPI